MKWLIWFPWILTLIVIAFRNGGYTRIEPGYRTHWGLSVTSVHSMIVYLFVLGVIVILAFLIGKRSFCHHICWMAPFMIIGRKIGRWIYTPAIRLIARNDKCIHCHQCYEKCPMSLDVEEMVNSSNMEHPECILCLSCVDHCRAGAINVRFSRDSHNEKDKKLLFCYGSWERIINTTFPFNHR